MTSEEESVVLVLDLVWLNLGKNTIPYAFISPQVLCWACAAPLLSGFGGVGWRRLEIKFLFCLSPTL